MATVRIDRDTVASREGLGYEPEIVRSPNWSSTNGGFARGMT
jgi:hypothetical protein